MGSGVHKHIGNPKGGGGGRGGGGVSVCSSYWKPTYNVKGIFPLCATFWAICIE